MYWGRLTARSRGVHCPAQGAKSGFGFPVLGCRQRASRWPELQSSRRVSQFGAFSRIALWGRFKAIRGEAA
jgi:hypothetical protein